MLIKDKNIEMVFIAETEGNINDLKEISIDKCQIKIKLYCNHVINEINPDRITYYIVITNGTNEINVIHT